ncbi:hypothetical protein MKK64_16300 [Methylobacterium sp. E-025]|uniref:hypothetical protein n=1 Tax=Methylobacterium sp. E-025 TaxID=2836561 RepID=UPI001FBB3DEB|nr:hypothetical protein [Methylobacterium sp. E-025]MCJ2112748.1 hypothetical protein [Methylobacterium sp. E-025]
MMAFGFLFGLVNLAISALCLLWWGADTSGSGAPAIVGVLSFNLALAWLTLAGLGQDATGNRTWSSRPALLAIGLAVFLGGGLFVQAAVGGRRAELSHFTDSLK